jgi:hypothetical protein
LRLDGSHHVGRAQIDALGRGGGGRAHNPETMRSLSCFFQQSATGMI